MYRSMVRKTCCKLLSDTWGFVTNCTDSRGQREYRKRYVPGLYVLHYFFLASQHPWSHSRALYFPDTGSSCQLDCSQADILPWFRHAAFSCFGMKEYGCQAISIDITRLLDYKLVKPLVTLSSMEYSCLLYCPYLKLKCPPLPKTVYSNAPLAASGIFESASEPGVNLYKMCV